MKDSDAQRLAENLQKLSIMLAVATSHLQQITEESLATSNALVEASFTIEDIYRGLPPEVYKKLKVKKIDLEGGLTGVGKEGFVSLVMKMLKGGRIKP
ncbi:hypothetical protein LCGC14_1883450 [marine sediment metagenome]|uniref:Uncharacterized protein n=1 Tax=marine sediment metagenome TaxID=412755 RepID=A0A0F9IZW1_9ZZZZ